MIRATEERTITITKAGIGDLLRNSYPVSGSPILTPVGIILDLLVPWADAIQMYRRICVGGRRCLSRNDALSAREIKGLLKKKQYLRALYRVFDDAPTDLIGADLAITFVEKHFPEELYLRLNEEDLPIFEVYR